MSKLHPLAPPFALALTLLSCSGGGGSNSCNSSRQGPSYTWQAADASAFFRWTTDPEHLNHDVWIYAEIDDRPESLPPGYDGNGVSAYHNARMQWRVAMEGSGLDVESSTLLLSSGEHHPYSRARMIVNFVDIIPSPADALGRTHPVLTAGGDLDHVLIELAMRTQAGRTLTVAERGAVAVHEYGHALGFWKESTHGHSSNPDDVMYPSLTSCQWTTLSDGDKASIVELYHAIPTILGEGYVAP